MNKQEFLAANLPHGLKYQTRICDAVENNLILEPSAISKKGFARFDHGGDWGYEAFDDIKPIVRPFDSLTKECVQADYNEGKPFIPIVEIQKRNDFIHILNNHFVIGVQTIYEIDELPTWVTQLLLKWHFDLITENCEKIFVTEEFNPYINAK